jgi:hypothetical protein
MGLQTVPGYIGQAAYQHPVELDRNMLEGMFGRTGLLRVGDFTIAPTGTAQQISITAGRAFLLGAESLQQGGYFVWSDNTENKVFGPPSGSARIDSLILRVVDTQYGSDPGSPRAEWDIVAGVASGSPTARPDSDFNTGGTFYKPGAWWRVADVRINPGDTVIPGGQITRNTRYVRLPGGVAMCTSTTRPSDPALGDRIYETDTKREFIWNGTAWTWPYGKGLVGGNRYTAGKAVGRAIGIGTGEGNSNIATPALVLEANRSFEIRVNARVRASNVAEITMRVRETNVGGTSRGYYVRIPAVANFPEHHTWSAHYETGGADEAKTLILTGFVGAGTLDFYAGDSEELVSIEVWDKGPSGIVGVVT